MPFASVVRCQPCEASLAEPRCCTVHIPTHTSALLLQRRCNCCCIVPLRKPALDPAHPTRTLRSRSPSRLSHPVQRRVPSISHVNLPVVRVLHVHECLVCMICHIFYLCTTHSRHGCLAVRLSGDANERARQVSELDKRLINPALGEKTKSKRSRKRSPKKKMGAVAPQAVERGIAAAASIAHAEVRTSPKCSRALLCNTYRTEKHQQCRVSL